MNFFKPGTGGLSSLYLSVFLLSLNGLFARTITLDSTSITQLRSVIATCSLLVLFRLGRAAPTLTTRQWWIVYGLGILLGLHWVSFFQAMQVSSVAVGILALFTYPVFTVFLEPLFQRKSLCWQDLLAALLVSLGVAIMVSDQFFQAGQLTQQQIQWGVAWGVISAILFALRNTSQKYLLADIPSTTIMRHQTLAIALLLAAFTDWQAVQKLDTKNWLLLFLLGVFCTAAAHTLVAVSLKRLAAKTVSLISCLQPFLAALFAWWLLHEHPSVPVICGGLIIISVAIFESRQVQR